MLLVILFIKGAIVLFVNPLASMIHVMVSVHDVTLRSSLADDWSVFDTIGRCLIEMIDGQPDGYGIFSDPLLADLA